MIVKIIHEYEGIVFGVGNDGKPYIGTPTEIPVEQLTVTTDVASDGQSYERTVSHGSEVVSISVVTKQDFTDARLMAHIRPGKPLEKDAKRDKEIEKAWEDDCELTTLPPSGLNPTETVYNWRAV